MKRWSTVEEEVREYLGEFADQFDVAAIVKEIKDAGLGSIDEMDPDEFQRIVESHEKEA